MATSPMMTDNFQWQKISQARLHVEVDKVIDLITKPPRPVPNMPLAEWSLAESNGRTAVRHAGWIPCAYYQYKLPATLKGTHPVLIGAGNGKLFIIDGAHRIAKGLLDGRVAIPAVILTEGETRACIRPGMEKGFDEKVGHAAKP